MTKNDNLLGGGGNFYWTAVASSDHHLDIHQHRWWCMKFLKMTSTNQALNLDKKRQRLLLQNFLTESKHTHNSLSDCPSFVVWIDVVKRLYARCSVQAPQSTSKLSWSTLQATGAKWFNPYPTALPYGNGMVLHFYQQQESSTTKTVHRVINKGLKAYV